MSSKLEDAFVEDHRKLTRGLSRLMELVEAERDDDAAALARRVDEESGPHIEFEENAFYPQVGKTRDRDYVDNLYDEHRSGLEAVRRLSNLTGGESLDPDERRAVLFHLRRAHDHAVSCGTLLSHVTSLPESEQEHFLAELERCRKLGHRWTELHADD